MQINSFAEFKSYINNEAKRKTINIIRFINVESLELWVRVKNFLSERCPNHVRLSRYCAGDDLVPNISMLQKDLKNIETNTILLPLSEYLRINTENAFYILNDIIFLQFKNDIYGHDVRLYIPVYKMRNSLNKLLAIHERFNDSVIFLDEKYDNDYSLTIISKNLNAQIKGNNIFGLKDYFEYWEDSPSKPIILHTDNAQYYKNSLFEENVKVLVTAFDIIEYHNLMGHKVQEEWGSEWQWQELLSRLKNSNRIESLFETTFEINKFNDVLLLSRWKDCNDFEKWLIWLWAKFDCKSRYLSDVLSSTTSFNELVTCIIEKIFDYDYKAPEYKEIFFERKKLLSAINPDELTSAFWEKYEMLSAEEKVFRLTDCTRREKIEFIRVIGKTHLNVKLRERLRDVYPALYGYLNDFPFVNQEFTNYFQDYKVCKLTNQFSDEFVNRVSIIASRKGADVWRLNSRNKLVDEYYDQNTLILWVDNLCVDDVGLIQFFLNEEYKSVYYFIDIGYSALPSITEINKDFLNNRKCKQYKYGILDLDEIKHSGEYPEYIVDEIDIVLDIVKNAVNELEVFNKVVITSDHGSSRGAVIAKGNTYKAKEGAQVERHGRYCIDAKNQYETEIEVCFDIAEYHIMGNYDRFSISGNIRGQIHGGATLEEMLVPVIVLSKSPLEEKVNIQLLTEIIRPQDNIVKFRVDRDYKELFATVDLKRYECKKVGDYWCFALEIGKKNEYEVKITSRGNVGEFKVKVAKGRIDSEKFDL